MKKNYPLWENTAETERRAIYEVYVKNFHNGYDFFDDKPMTFEEFNECNQFSTFRCIKHHYTGEWK